MTIWLLWKSDFRLFYWIFQTYSKRILLYIQNLPLLVNAKQNPHTIEHKTKPTYDFLCLARFGRKGRESSHHDCSLEWFSLQSRMGRIEAFSTSFTHGLRHINSKSEVRWYTYRQWPFYPSTVNFNGGLIMVEVAVELF